MVRPRQPLPKDLPSIWKEHEVKATMDQSASEEDRNNESPNHQSSSISIIKSGTIKGVDFNENSDMWHSHGNNNTGRVKGRKVEGMIRDLFLKMQNQPNQPNIHRRTNIGSSNIDITLSTKDLEYNLKNWRVKTETTDSNHRLI